MEMTNVLSAVVSIVHTLCIFEVFHRPPNARDRAEAFHEQGHQVQRLGVACERISLLGIQFSQVYQGWVAFNTCGMGLVYSTG